MSNVNLTIFKYLFENVSEPTQLIIKKQFNYLINYSFEIASYEWLLSCINMFMEDSIRFMVEQIIWEKRYRKMYENVKKSSTYKQLFGGG